MITSLTYLQAITERLRQNAHDGHAALPHALHVLASVYDQKSPSNLVSQYAEPFHRPGSDTHCSIACITVTVSIDTHCSVDFTVVTPGTELRDAISQFIISLS
jgi:hypothetical protein